MIGMGFQPAKNFLQQGSEGLRGDVVALAIQGAARHITEDIRERLRRGAPPGGGRPSIDHERGLQ